jgi:hypothetical protein
MKFKISLLKIFTLIVLPGAIRAQTSIEFGVLLGASTYYGDLNGQQLSPSHIHPSAAILGRYNINERWAVKGFIGYGRISGADSISTSSRDKLRNLSFISDIFEVSAQIELNLIKNKLGYNSTNRVIPYLFSGLAIFNFNPRTTYKGREYELQPLGTEGQGTTEYNDREKYALTQISIPLGVGLKKRFGKHFTFGIEGGLRYTFTNYLDDIGGKFANNNVVRRASGEVAGALADRSAEVNPLGFPTFAEGRSRSKKWMPLNDIYILGGISITYRFVPQGMKCPKF